MVKYIFSDKTGTLTCNIMEFKHICVEGLGYGSNSSHEIISDEELKGLPNVTNVDFRDKTFVSKVLGNSQDSSAKACRDALVLLSLCHDIIVEEKDGDKIFNASSPDELALVNFAKLCGWCYEGLDNENNMLLNV